MIFISYSHKDKEYAHRLQNALEREGFEVWIDDRIDYGDQWAQVTQNKLDEADAFVLIMTPRSYESDLVQNELLRAQRKKKPIIPLLLEGKPFLLLEAFQHIDVRNGSMPPERFYQHLEGMVKSKIPFSSAEQEPSKIQRPSFLRWLLERLAGDTTTDAPLPDIRKKKKKGRGR